MRGAAIDITTNKQTGGHAWVVDGYGTVTYIAEWYYNKSDSNQIVIRQNTLSNAILVHCNLGWDGNNRGYAVNREYAVVNGNSSAFQEDDYNPNKGWFIYGIFNTAGNLTPENKDIREGGENYSTNTYIVIPVKQGG